MKLMKPIAAVTLGMLSLAVSLSAGAALVMAPLQSMNDCPGLFGGSFSECAITHTDTTISPVIAKFGTDDDNLNIGTEFEKSTLWPSVSADGSEWSFTNVDPDESKSGTWNYTPDDPQDPGIRFWSTKAGNEPIGLWWTVDDAEKATGGACGGPSVFTLDCLQAARVVTNGEWSVGKGLSHITFYDSEGPTLIPIPAAFWLFGSALAGLTGLGYRRRRRFPN